MIRLKTGGKEFAVHKAVLTPKSEYFSKCLNGDFKEAREMIITLDDIDAEHLNVYLKACYAETFASKRDIRIEPTDQRSFYSIAELVDLWKLCDRFIRKSLIKVTELTIKRTITTMGQTLKSSWKYSHDINLFAAGFQILRANPQAGGSADTEEALSTFLVNMFCKYCSSHNWSEVATTLPVEFVAEVSIRWCTEKEGWNSYGDREKLAVTDVM